VVYCDDSSVTTPQQPSPPTSGHAKASVILGALSACTFLTCISPLLSIPAIVLGHIALVEIKIGNRSGASTAHLGLLFGYLITALWTIAGVAQILE
jgi:hypothetical protein